MCGPSSLVLLVIGSICGEACSHVVLRGDVLDDIPSMACGLPTGLLSVGILRLGVCTMRKCS